MNRFVLAAACLLGAGISRAELRTFTNLRGEAISAELLDASDSRAELKRADGRKFSVPLDSLTEADRAFIAEWRKTHRRFKVEVTVAEKKSNSRSEKGATFDGRDIKGNDCWYVLNFSNKTAQPLAALRVEWIIFARENAAIPSLAGTTDVPTIPPAKSRRAATGKLFAPQQETVFRAGNSSTVRFSESSLAGIHAELIVAGKPAGTFINGTVPADAAAQLQAWRDLRGPATAPAPPVPPAPAPP